MSWAPRHKSITLGSISITFALLGVLLAVICGILGFFSEVVVPEIQESTLGAPLSSEEYFRLGRSEEEAAPVGTEVDLGSLRTKINSVAIDDTLAKSAIGPESVYITVNVTTDTMLFESWMFNRGKPMITFYYYSQSGEQYAEHLELRDQHSHRNNALDSTMPITTGNVSFIVPRANAEAGIMTAEIAGTSYQAYLALS